MKTQKAVAENVGNNRRKLKFDELFGAEPFSATRSVVDNLKSNYIVSS